MKYSHSSLSSLRNYDRGVVGDWAGSVGASGILSSWNPIHCWRLDCFFPVKYRITRTTATENNAVRTRAAINHCWWLFFCFWSGSFSSSLFTWSGVILSDRSEMRQIANPNGSSYRLELQFEDVGSPSVPGRSSAHRTTRLSWFWLKRNFTFVFPSNRLGCAVVSRI